MPVLAFDPAAHAYTLDGAPVPSVTTALKRLPNAYAMVDEATLERAAELGRAVHRVIELELAGTLDEEDLDDALRPYLAMFRDFMARSGFEPILSEAQVYSTRYRYAGTLDLFGRLPSRNGGKRFAVIDAKRTAAVPRSAGPQTAAYESALRECRPDLVPNAAEVDRYALHLTPTRWQLVRFPDFADLRVFLAALTIHHWSAE